MRNSSSLDWLRFMHTPNDYRVSRNYRWAMVNLSLGNRDFTIAQRHFYE